jgi:hypothetical protein
MLYSAARSSSESELLALEVLATEAQRAGAALACAFSSSAEFDAALIAERRAAGVYGPRRHRKQKLAAIAGIAAALAVIIFLIA